MIPEKDPDLEAGLPWRWAFILGKSFHIYMELGPGSRSEIKDDFRPQKKCARITVGSQ